MVSYSVYIYNYQTKLTIHSCPTTRGWTWPGQYLIIRHVLNQLPALIKILVWLQECVADTWNCPSYAPSLHSNILFLYHFTQSTCISQTFNLTKGKSDKTQQLDLLGCTTCGYLPLSMKLLYIKITETITSFICTHNGWFASNSNRLDILQVLTGYTALSPEESLPGHPLETA